MDTKKYNFDEIIDRRNTESSKWGFLKEKFGDSDIIPLPVADMDLRSAEPINNALKKRVEHGIFGYTGMNKEYYQSIINWFQRKYNWKIEKDWIISTPGVVPAIYTAETTFSKPREAILIQTPAYMPFLMARMLRRNLVLNELIYANNTYKIDFDDLAEKADTTKNPKLKMMIICNPHNPVGRVWTKKELQKMGDICLENKLLVISDEIHQDLIFKGYKHTPFATISEEFANRSITCTAPSKTFNLAGLHNSNIIIPNVRIRKKFKAEMFKSAFMSPNVFGLVAMKTAYNEGENWLNQV
ncbi:MAG: putative C-S lyase, partial [archaeon]|nr:putative C-S lyase [archaeon]